MLSIMYIQVRATTGASPSLLPRLHSPLENKLENGERMERDSMLAKYLQGDNLLRMLARSYKSNFCMVYWGDFERQKPFVC